MRRPFPETSSATSTLSTMKPARVGRLGWSGEGVGCNGVTRETRFVANYRGFLYSNHTLVQKEWQKTNQPTEIMLP